MIKDGFKKKHIHSWQNFPSWVNSIYQCENSNNRMGLRRNRFMVDKTSHHGLIAFTNVKTQMAQDGFMKKHIHVGLTSHLEWHLQTADCKSVRNIPKFKDRANWSRETFQPMRRRACVYQNTNQNIAPVIKNFHNSGQSPTESVIVLRLSGICLRLFMRRTQFF